METNNATNFVPNQELNPVMDNTNYFAPNLAQNNAPQSIPILSTHNITKRYGTINAVDSVNLSVQKGDIYGLVGLNGSGKTTLIRLITSLIKPTSGNIRLFGKDGNNPEHLTRISSMIEKPAIYTNLSAIDNLEAQCAIVGLTGASKIDAKKRLLQLVGLDGVGKKPSKDFSLGMKQRLGIAMALVGDPEFMLLDEPTNGLDPAGIGQMRELLLKVNKEQGITILICSHILVELAKMASRYGFIHRGKLIHETSAEDLTKACQMRTRLEISNADAAIAAFSANNIVASPTKLYNTIELTENLPVSQIYSILSPKNIEILRMQSSGGDLESYFTNLIYKYDAACSNVGGHIR